LFHICFHELLAGAPLLCCLFQVTVHAAQGNNGVLGPTQAPIGLFAIGIFVLAYILVMTEVFTHLRKSRPVILSARVALMGQARGKYTFFAHL
jgi:hypothetical protein